MLLSRKRIVNHEKKLKPKLYIKSDMFLQSVQRLAWLRNRVIRIFHQDRQESVPDSLSCFWPLPKKLLMLIREEMKTCLGDELKILFREIT